LLHLLSEIDSQQHTVTVLTAAENEGRLQMSAGIRFSFQVVTVSQGDLGFTGAFSIDDFYNIGEPLRKLLQARGITQEPYRLSHEQALQLRRLMQQHSSDEDLYVPVEGPCLEHPGHRMIYGLEYNRVLNHPNLRHMSVLPSGVMTVSGRPLSFAYGLNVVAQAKAA
jgi:hypothetical protein